jgi:hypothetical protein
VDRSPGKQAAIDSQKSPARKRPAQDRSVACDGRTATQPDYAALAGSEGAAAGW